LSYNRHITRMTNSNLKICFEISSIIFNIEILYTLVRYFEIKKGGL